MPPVALSSCGPEGRLRAARWHGWWRVLGARVDELEGCPRRYFAVGERLVRLEDDAVALQAEAVGVTWVVE
jgi:hypothetical protein